LVRLLLPSIVLVAIAFVACGRGEPAASPPADGPAPPQATGRAPGQSATQTPLRPPTPTPRIDPGLQGIEYTVQPGDTLFSIAQRFGTTVEAIARANGLTDTSRITAGQALFVPGTVTPAPTPAPTATPTSAPTTPEPSAGGGPAEVVRRGNTNRNIVAFSFDAGSDAGYTVLILDTLATNGIKASFGITGAWAERYPDLMRRIVQEGHHLINHSYDHPSFTGRSVNRQPLTRAERWEQLDRTEEIVRELTGATTKPYFRPPFGDYDDSVNADVGARGYRYNVMWTVDSRGWQGIPEGQIIQRSLDLAEPGAIYVFHVGSASQDGPALQEIIDGLRERGYQMGTVEDVLS
jgi:peptidoglycan/xylan/chitin deacetylase (PgdA/CDA1 family)